MIAARKRMEEGHEASPEADSVTASRQVLVVRVGGIIACIDLDAVERTFSLVELQPVPGASPWVAGIMNYGGSSLAVVDIALRLGLPVQAYQIETPIIVCEWKSRRVGLIVDDIVGNQMAGPNDIQLSNSFQQPGAAFTASVHTSLGLAFMLDTDWLLNADLYGRAVPMMPVPVATIRQTAYAGA